MTEMGRGAERSVQDLAGELAETAVELYERLELKRQLREHPYRTLAAAAGVGYVLGGGLFTPLTGSLVRVGMRAMLLPMVQQVLEGIATAEDESTPYF